jgi:L-ascorbate metabolism protein UlaG (beta-lactamase superfamily)
MFRFLFLVYLLSFGCYTTIFAQEVNQITYIANSGVFIEKEGKKILIDALHKKYHSLYQATKPPYPKMLINGDTPFAELDLFLITHVHEDHFNGEYMSDFLKQHEEAILIAPQQVIDSMTAIEPIEAQIYPLKGTDKGLSYELDGIQITTIPLEHSYPEKNSWVHNMAYLINVEGTTILHVGDANMTAKNYDLIARYTKKGVDYAILPFWYFEEENPTWRKKIKAKKYIAVHVTTNKSGTFEGILKKKMAKFGIDLNVFITIGEFQPIEE